MAPNATKLDGDADNDLDVDADDLSVWETQYGTDSAPLAALVTVSSEQVTASFQESQTAVLATKPLSAELIDAAIVMDHALRSKFASHLAPPTPLREDHFDWLSRSPWSYRGLTWQGASEIANYSFRGQENKFYDHRFHGDEDDAVNEELLDELFADSEFNSLL